MHLHSFLTDPPKLIHEHCGIQDIYNALREFEVVDSALCRCRFQVWALCICLDALKYNNIVLQTLRDVGRLARDTALSLAPLARNGLLWGLSESDSNRLVKAACLLRRAAIRLGVTVDEHMLAAAFRVLVDSVPRDSGDLVEWISRKTIPERRVLWSLLRNAVDTAEEAEIIRLPEPRRLVFSSVVDVAVGVLEWVQTVDDAN